MNTNEGLTAIKTINFFDKVFGFDTPCYMRVFVKRTRNPDVFTYDSSIDYKEDFGLVEGSYCDCGCKSAVYVKEEWDGDATYTELKTQVEWEKLPDKPIPTPEQIKLQTDIIRANREEEELGIIHGQRSCGAIPVPKLVFNADMLTK